MLCSSPVCWYEQHSSTTYETRNISRSRLKNNSPRARTEPCRCRPTHDVRTTRVQAAFAGWQHGCATANAALLLGDVGDTQSSCREVRCIVSLTPPLSLQGRDGPRTAPAHARPPPTRQTSRQRTRVEAQHALLWTRQHLPCCSAAATAPAKTTALPALARRLVGSPG